jgi:hypothetical protein
VDLLTTFGRYQPPPEAVETPAVSMIEPTEASRRPTAMAAVRFVIAAMDAVPAHAAFHIFAPAVTVIVPWAHARPK